MSPEPFEGNLPATDAPGRCPRTSQMTASSAQICRDLGWDIGTVLSARDNDGTERQIRLTAIGECEVLAVHQLVRDELVENPQEMIVRLTCRDWERA